MSIVDVTKTTLTVEASGKPEKLEALRELLSEYGIVELSRTGRIALSRGDRGIREKGGLRMAKAAGAEDGGVDGRRRLATRSNGGDSKMATIYHEQDTDVSALAGQKIAVLGFGSQGHAHAQNLKDSGHDVRVGLRPGSSSRAKAEEAGLRVLDIGEAVAEADVVMVLLPDTSHGKVYAEDIAPHLNAGDMLMFAHGFSIHFGTVTPPADVDVTMIAPEGSRPPRAPDVRGGHRDARTGRGAAGRDRQGAAARARLRRRDRRGPRRDHRDHVQGGDRDRSVRRADGAVRRAVRADPLRVRHARRGRLPARDRVLRVPARDEADRRPDLRGRPVVDALLRSPTPPSGATTRAARA